MANISSGWFAVFSSTWQRRSEAARGDGRDGPNLIVFRTRSADPRDHYVIPYAVIRDFLTDETLTHSAVNGSDRWNLTLRDSQLHVTHRPGKLDVSQYYGAPLIGESQETVKSREPSISALEETASRGVLEGIAKEVTVIARSRSRKLRDAAMKRANGSCDCCGINFTSLFNGKGLRALQVHHKHQLAVQDTPKVTSADDLAVVCATCHAIIHSDQRRALPVDVLRDLWDRHRSGAA